MDFDQAACNGVKPLDDTLQSLASNVLSVKTIFGFAMQGIITN